ncbi:hypothetical protein STIAU_3240 [Stigmatella aurantiaca DW4/3-1]|nr:hypothetical protein STIAU_3240 [Stigmatella aurantiaca DW4/3-1]
MRGSQRQQPDGSFPLLSNGNERYPVTIRGLETPTSQAPGNQPLLDIHAKLSLDGTVIAAAEDVLESMGEGARAFWGHATPGSAALDIAEQTSPTLAGPPCPTHLGWLNHWAAAAAKAIGFLAPSHDADLLSRSRRTATGGWVVRLANEPLDLDNPTHLDALLRAYERFPKIGGRVTPR